MSALPAPAHDPRDAADLALLRDAAEEAGRIARRYHRRGPRAWDKAGGAGPVTEADIAVDDMLRARLTAARPGYGWLSEETEDAHRAPGPARTFVIDPIDGTRAFMEGSDGFSHALAVVEHGTPRAAVVALPARRDGAGETYAAALGHGATLDGAPIAASRVAEPEAAQILASRAAWEAARWRGGPRGTRRFRSSLAWRLCLVAAGRFDAMVTLHPAWEWDIAAGALIATEAGARVTDPRGRALTYNAPHPKVPGVVAAGAVHGGLLARLA
jgi:myo-inositol-1(or 4)-monophosphatase